MDFNPTDPADTSPRPDAPPSPDSAGFEHQLSALQALAEAPDYDQDRICQEIAPAPSRAGPSRAAEASDCGSDSIWQHLESELMRGGHRDPARREPGRRRRRALGGQNSEISSGKTDVAPRSTCATMTRDFEPRLSDF